MLTLSQILVVHRRNHGNDKMRLSDQDVTVHAVFNAMEMMIASMMKKNYVPLEQNNEMLFAYIYSERIKRLILSEIQKQNRTQRTLEETNETVNRTCVRERISRQLQFVVQMNTKSDNQSKEQIYDRNTSNTSENYTSDCQSTGQRDKRCRPSRTSDLIKIKDPLFSTKRQLCSALPNGLGLYKEYIGHFFKFKHCVYMQN